MIIAEHIVLDGQPRHVRYVHDWTGMVIVKDYKTGEFITCWLKEWHDKRERAT